MLKLTEFKNKKGEVLRGLIDKVASDKGIIFVHGFERTTIEAKFKNIVDNLKDKVNLFRFDFSGCGLSDGKFNDLTVGKLARDLSEAIKIFTEKCPDIEKINLVGHSLGCCVVLELLKENNQKFNKIVFLAPAFNQKELQRYWFVKSEAKKDNVEINWLNFKNYLSEEKFQENIKIKKRMTKGHEILNNYYRESEKKDYQDSLHSLDADYKNILVIHGEDDDNVPLESNNRLSNDIKIIKVADGDHDLQRPDMVKQYLQKAVDFLMK